MNDYDEHDEGCETATRVNWRFSLWDVAGITLSGVSGLFAVGAQAIGLLSQECAAMANFTRDRRDQREAIEAYEADRAEMAQTLETFVLYNQEEGQ